MAKILVGEESEGRHYESRWWIRKKNERGTKWRGATAADSNTFGLNKRWGINF